jgi:hypothetical protein
VTYLNALWLIATSEGPSQVPLKSVTTEPYAAALVESSLANPSHAAAAPNNGPAPAPEYIKPELISGGSAAKYITRLQLDHQLCLGSYRGLNLALRPQNSGEVYVYGITIGAYATLAGTDLAKRTTKSRDALTITHLHRHNSLHSLLHAEYRWAYTTS